ncbi:MAG: type II secretion system F family protein [Hyphomicrobiaceae bacterium]
MGDFDLMPVGVALLGALAIAAVVFTFLWPYLSGEKKTEKRISNVSANRARGAGKRVATDNAASRRKAVADTLKELETRQKSREKVTLRSRLERAGMEASPKTFYTWSAISGVITAALCFLSFPTAPLAAPIAGFVGAFGLPRWYLKHVTKRRQTKFLKEFANAIDVIVRGVKSGLPLNECLGIISRESPEPIASEMTQVVEQQRVGIPLGECLDRLMDRVPLPEVKFFAVVIAIQQQAGGNLSEALGNLSGVLRDRVKLQMKVKALSAEAKASAGVLAALPPVVGTLVFLTSPSYIALLWSTKTGQFLLLLSAFWMFCGVMVMKKMINFKF